MDSGIAASAFGLLAMTTWAGKSARPTGEAVAWTHLSAKSDCRGGVPPPRDDARIGLHPAMVPALLRKKNARELSPPGIDHLIT
jgi:hypothetical protein